MNPRAGTEVRRPVRYRVVEFFRRTDAWDSFLELDRLQWESSQVLRESQIASLGRLLTHCFEHVPFYRKWHQVRGGKPGLDSPIERLSSLPVVGKPEMRSDTAAFLADNASAFQPRPCCTGGTTGGMLHFQLSRQAHSNSVAYNLLQWHEVGHSLGDPMVYLGGSSLAHSLSQFKVWTYLRLQNILPLSSFGMNADVMRRHVAAIRRSRARFLRGYAGSIALLAQYVLEEGVRGLEMEAVVTTAETLYEHYRRTIEAAFSCPVFNEYGARDGSMLAFECSRHGGLHVGTPSCLVEILDDDDFPVATGETGNLVLTSLDNWAFPFVRYRVGDRGAWASTPCPCGRGFATLAHVEGRSGDFVKTPDGRNIHSEFFSHLFWQFPEVAQFQVRQETESELDVMFVADGGQLQAGHFLQAGIELRRACGPGMKVNLRAVDEIPVTASGKWRYVVSSMDDQG